MTDITLSDIAIKVLILTAIVFFLAIFINIIVILSNVINFNYDKWQWYTWFLFIMGCIVVIMTGCYLIPIIQLNLDAWLKTYKSRESKKKLMREILDYLKKEKDTN